MNTPEKITHLKPNQIFVFGSNESGRHGKGAAKMAHDKFGAVYGVGFGRTGQCFAIPTKDWVLSTLPLKSIHHYVQRFMDYARANKSLEFLVTKIGCGLAGYSAKEIALMFLDAPSNCILPKEFTDEYHKLL